MTFLDGITSLLSHLRLKKYSPATLDNYGDQLKRFGEWLDKQSIHDLRQLSKQHIRDYQAYVKQEPIGRETQALRIRAVKRLFNHLVDQATILLDPTEGIKEISRREKLPRPVLTKKEMDKLFAAPNLSLPLGIRDRALIEVLYATGIRVGELEKVTIHHVDLPTQTLQIRHAKGGRPRTVPLGKTATKWLKEYLTQVRPRLAKRRPFERALFLVRGGKPLAQTMIRHLLQQCRKDANIKKSVTPHILRHTCATHLLQHGADIRAIQQLLGHVSLKSTTIYTRVVPLEVKATHTQYHPNERKDGPHEDQ
ncbi:MAG: tyrosine-type recombinase/integrase [Ectothiorhodospiraceae bacterium]|nr:tyrosine-type recombinase/integrase [Ectothiorhodospiraceae bacterium]